MSAVDLFTYGTQSVQRTEQEGQCPSVSYEIQLIHFITEPLTMTNINSLPSHVLACLALVCICNKFNLKNTFYSKNNDVTLYRGKAMTWASTTVDTTVAVRWSFCRHLCRFITQRDAFKKSYFWWKICILCRKPTIFLCQNFKYTNIALCSCDIMAVIFWTLYSCFRLPYLHNSDNTPDADVIYSFQQTIKAKNPGP